jgi:hypothetical protein
VTGHSTAQHSTAERRRVGRCDTTTTTTNTTTTDTDAPQSLELHRLIFHFLRDPRQLAALLFLSVVEVVQSFLRLVVKAFEIEEPVREEGGSE